MITKFGKRFLTDFIAGNSNFIDKEMAIGIANNIEYELSDTNSRLGFEFLRIPVKFGGIDIDASVSPTKYTVIYSGIMPSNTSGKINELGIYPGGRISTNRFDDKFITDFELPYDWSIIPDIDQTNYRVGNSSLIFKSDGTQSREYKIVLNDFDLSGYSNFDSLSFSYRVNNAYLSNIKINFYTTDNDYYQMVFDEHAQGWNIKEIDLSELQVFGSPDKANISTMGVVITPTSSEASVSVDGLRINDEDTFDPVYGLVARSILTDEIEKVAGRELRIEYKLDLSFGD